MVFYRMLDSPLIEEIDWVSAIGGRLSARKSHVEGARTLVRCASLLNSQFDVLVHVSPLGNSHPQTVRHRASNSQLELAFECGSAFEPTLVFHTQKTWTVDFKVTA